LRNGKYLFSVDPQFAANNWWRTWHYSFPTKRAAYDGGASIELRSPGAYHEQLLAPVMLTPGKYVLKAHVKGKNITWWPEHMQYPIRLRLSGQTEGGRQLTYEKPFKLKTGDSDWTEIAMPFELKENLYQPQFRFSKARFDQYGVTDNGVVFLDAISLSSADKK
jgi:hypothetical protein